MSEISLYRVKHLLLMQTERRENGINLSRWILYPIFIVLFVGLASFTVWLDFYENLIWLMYFMISYAFFSMLNRDKGYETDYLLHPASVKEKIIVHIILAIGLPTIMLAVVIPAIILIQGWANLNAGHDFLSYMPVLKILTVANFFKGLLLQALIGFFCLTFRKHTFIYSLIAFLPFVAVITSVEVLLANYSLNTKAVLFLFNGILLCLTVFVWIANYYKLKKREI